MSTIKDALKGAQAGGSDRPKINAIPMELKEQNGDAVFTVWNKDTKENIITPSPIKGILIGIAMQARAYSDQLGKNGGNYQSAYYMTNKNIALFAPTHKGYEVVCAGDLEAIASFIAREAGSGTVLKKKQVLFVLTENGLYGIINNLSIGIDQYGVNKEALTEKYIILNPKTFEESDKLISKKAKEYLGKFRTKNPPKYAEITTGELITIEDWDAWDAQKEVDNYKKWKEYNMGAPEQPEARKSETPPAKVETTPEPEFTDSNFDELMPEEKEKYEPPF